MIVGIHQPNFIPWIGYFYKIYRSDIFVFLDTAQYEKNSFADRNTVKASNNAVQIKLPVQYTHHTDSYNKVTVNVNDYWIKKTLKTLEYNYKKAKCFEQVYEDVNRWLKRTNLSLSEYNSLIIIDICKKLQFETSIRFSRDLNINSTNVQRIIDICKYFEADTYYSGRGASNYQSEELFRKNDISLRYTDFTHPIYIQQWKTFLPNLSILDLLFNEGYENASQIVRESGLKGSAIF